MSDNENFPRSFPKDKEKFDVRTGTYQGHNVLNYKPWQVEKYTRNYLHFKGRYDWRVYNNGKGVSKRKDPNFQLKQSQEAELDEFYDEDGIDAERMNEFYEYFDERVPFEEDQAWGMQT